MNHRASSDVVPTDAFDDPVMLGDLADAESILADLAGVFFQSSSSAYDSTARKSDPGPDIEARYKVLIEQLPAVVFMAYLDQGIGEAYVSPQIEATLGFTQQEWLEDPVLWYRQVHPGDKERWSIEAAGMFLSGKPLTSSYRVLARDGRTVWFHCEARLVRRNDGRPWFIHGVGFDITQLKAAERALQEERNVVAAILDTVGALVVVLDKRGRIVRFNRACEQTTGYAFSEVDGKQVWDLFALPEELERFRSIFDQLCSGVLPSDYESHWLTRSGERRLISWSTTVLTDSSDGVTHIIATGIDITERKGLEKAVLEVGAREQRRIGQDLHDGLGQHLTGIAFMGKVLEDRLSEASLAEAAEAAKIVRLVNDSIKMTRELARGLLPVVSEARGLMSALERWAVEVSDLFLVDCRFECPVAVLVFDETLAEHVYYMAQESVNNAIKHAKARRITIGLTEANDTGSLTVRDDGSGFMMGPGAHTGLGLRIMEYRARMIGGVLDVESAPGEGTVVRCSFPIRQRHLGETNAY
jgi:PAS domain S-box-containing protein